MRCAVRRRRDAAIPAYRSSCASRARASRCGCAPRPLRGDTGAPLRRLMPARARDASTVPGVMSQSADFSRVIALSQKGAELVLKGHNARAAEKFRAAAEEAEKVLLAPDCLVVSALRHEQLDALLGHATASVQPADADDALREVWSRLLPSVMEVLQRRKAAGTLLVGACRAVEVSWALAEKRHNLALQGVSPAAVEVSAEALSHCVGIETFFRVAASVAFLLMNAVPLSRVLQFSDARVEAASLFLLSALELMLLPRPGDDDAWLAGEPELVRHMRELDPVMSALDDSAAARQVHDAWRRVLRSGVLRARGINDGIEAVHQLHRDIRAKKDASLAAGKLRACALGGCAAREAHEAQFKQCAACHTVCYCCREHQVADWPAHKAACKAARRTLAAPAAKAP